MSEYYKRLQLNNLEQFQTTISDLYVTDPIVSNVTGPIPLFKSGQPEPEYKYSLLAWAPIQILTGSNSISPAYFRVFGLPQQTYPIVEQGHDIKVHHRQARDSKEVLTAHLLQLIMYIPILNGADHTIELYDPDSEELLDSFALTTPVLVDSNLKMKSVINNPNGCWHVQIQFVTKHAYAMTGNMLLQTIGTPMAPGALSFPASQILPD